MKSARLPRQSTCALALMCKRAIQRVAFGKTIAQQTVVVVGSKLLPSIGIGLNARALDASEFIAECHEWAGAEAEFDGYFSVLVADLSFISLTLVLPAVVPLLAPEGHLLVLVKPQFELQPGQVGKGGIVRDAALYGVVEQRLRDCCAALGLEVTAWFDSPIEGGDGNREFFLAARRGR